MIDNINLLRAMIAMNIFKLKKTDETRTYYNEEIKQNDLMSKKKKRFVQLCTLKMCSIIAGIKRYNSIKV